MTDLEKAQKIKEKFSLAIDNGLNYADRAWKAIEGHMNGYETGEYDYPLIAYCGEYIVLLEDRGEIYKKL